MNEHIGYMTILACYLPKGWREAYYFKTGYEGSYDPWDLHYFPVDGLTDSAIEDLRNRELTSYAHRIIWDSTKEDVLLSCLGAELREAFKVESDGRDLRLGLKETLFRRVEERLQNGLLQELKAEDDADWVREYVRDRAERQRRHDFYPYGDGESALLREVPPICEDDSGGEGSPAQGGVQHEK
jgi:hypothetical protein